MEVDKLKVLGCKVSDNVYEEFCKLGNISENLRKAIEMYLISKVNYQKEEVNQNDSNDESLNIDED
jgi:hypothetical protein